MSWRVRFSPLSPLARLRLGIGAGLLACAVALAWLSSADEAHAEDAAQAVQLFHQMPSKLTVGVIGESMMPLEGVAGDKLTGFSGDLLRQLLPQDRVRIVPRVFSRRDELLNAACRGEVDIIIDRKSVV